MTGPRHRRRSDPEAPLVDLADVLLDDDVVERLRRAALDFDARAALPTADLRAVDADGRRRTSGRHRARLARIPPPAVDPVVDDEVLALLQEWRSEVTAQPLPALPVLPAAVRSAARRRRWSTKAARVTAARSVRPALAVGGALAGLLLGSTVVSAKEAAPGQPLFALTTILWPQEAASKAAMGQAWTAINELAAAIDRGDRPGMSTATAKVRDALARVEPDDRPTSWDTTIARAEDVEQAGESGPTTGGDGPAVTSSSASAGLPGPVSWPFPPVLAPGTAQAGSTDLPRTPSGAVSPSPQPVTGSSLPAGSSTTGPTGGASAATTPSSSAVEAGNAPAGVPVPGSTSADPGAAADGSTTGSGTAGTATASSSPSTAGGEPPVSTTGAAASTHSAEQSPVLPDPAHPSTADSAAPAHSAAPADGAASDPSSPAPGAAGTTDAADVPLAGSPEPMPSAGVPPAGSVSRVQPQAPPAPAPAPPPAATPEPDPLPTSTRAPATAVSTTTSLTG